jgi:VWFA-related protein
MNCPRWGDFPIAVVLGGSILILGVCASLSVPSLGQSPSDGAPQTVSTTASAPQSHVKSDSPEMTTHESSVPFQVRTNLVPVRVVVHDSQGRTVAHLTREDFRVLEDGKPQTISTFLVDTPAGLAKQAVRPESGEETATGLQLPTRFVALLFDDAHLKMEDVVQVRIATNRYIDTSISPTDRVAVFTVSRHSEMDFTDDRAKMHDALLHVLPQPVSGFGSPSDPVGGPDCPPMDYYEADLIANKNDQGALNLAAQDVMYCQPMPPPSASQAQQTVLAGQLKQAQEIAQAMALQVYSSGDTATQYSFRRLEEVVRRIAALPGQRIIVLISPGFIYPSHEYDLSRIIDRAAHSSVFINTLDARGVYAAANQGDASKANNRGNPALAAFSFAYRSQAQAAQGLLLSGLADGTGGFAFHDNNDFNAGLRMTAGAPGVSYLLGFVPQNFKNDGKFHKLKVVVSAKGSYTVQARQGYFAPMRSATPEEAAKQEIEDALYSQEELNGLPIRMKTQFYKSGPLDAKLSVLTHVDIARVQFRKAEDRNQDDLTVVTGLFDRNGNFISASQETVEFHLRDATLARLSRTGITLRLHLDVKPGGYLVRLVVRDSNAAVLSAQNGVVEIPF